VVLIIAIIGLALANRPLGGVASIDDTSAAESPSPESGSLESASLAPSLEISPSPSPEPTDSQSPGPTPLPRPTTTPTAPATTPRPATTPAPTVAPAQGPVHCIPEPTGWAVYVQDEVLPGGSMTVDLQGLPTGQKMTLVVDYADASHISLGDRYAGSPDSGGWTHMVWNWNVPVGTAIGAAKASWSGTCIEGRDLDGYGAFIVVEPNPSPEWSVWSSANQAWPGGQGEIRVQAYYGATCTVMVDYPGGAIQSGGTQEYLGNELSFLWTVPTDVPIGTGSYQVSCALNGVVKTSEGAFTVTAPP